VDRDPRPVGDSIVTASVRQGRAASDEYYVIDLCDEVLGVAALRQHRFPWLLGDVSPTTGRRAPLSVDAYWPDLNLVVEFYERQHEGAVTFFDKPDRLTVSGMHRGLQRALYDERRCELIPQHGIGLVIVTLDHFEHRRGKIIRNPARDGRSVARLLQEGRSQPTKS
jgi:hypothetical protein